MNLPACLCALVQTRAHVYVSRHVFVGAGAGMNVCERTCLYAHAHETCRAHTEKGINPYGIKRAFEDLTRFFDVVIINRKIIIGQKRASAILLE